MMLNMQTNILMHINILSLRAICTSAAIILKLAYKTYFQYVKLSAEVFVHPECYLHLSILMTFSLVMKKNNGYAIWLDKIIFINFQVLVQQICSITFHI